ncbi:CbtA family protein [Rhizobium leguminosarum]|uniref:CbtA family protein n=1 Tax=Rhizobium leguminosarum TaxID=384 RepID=UPI000420E747|nr:CbtA family protein [Rhizobium leguminosarum]MBY5361865.1 CbtA family protein [Rhizobium leguminosarum]MBY5664894.1 CbtA family protein [Rhizobium leguminosarum]MBY5677622.1 CbtA family protein [Rhizobium leguminosarum]
MSLFRSIVFTAALTGVIVGVSVSAVQFAGTSQLIAKAEVYEKAGEVEPQAITTSPMVDAHVHDAGHDHEEGAWEPADGFERMAFTVAANMLTAIGYALVLCGLIAMRGKPVTWREGLLWGLAGFACVMLAPMLGLPPELPGTPSAPLGGRQLWWIGTALATAAGIGLIAFKRKPWAALIAIALIAAPHLIGAPAAPEGTHALAPEALEHQFVAAAVMTSLLFWALLGSLSGTLFNRFERTT